MDPRNEHDELKDAPTLRALPKVDPFVVPEGFFERFPHQVQAKTGARRTSSSGLIGWILDRPLALRVAGITAILALISSAIFFALRQDVVVPVQVAEITIAPNEIDVDEFADDDLFAVLENEEEPFATAGDGLTQDEMAAYLENEELPLDLLIEEL